ncbi:SRPBCC family protein [Chloroflexota bacterium]
MTKYDVTDEAIINASPDVVYNAVIDEMDGKTNWWMPYHSTKLCAGDSYGKVGVIHDSTVRIHGKLPIKFTTKTVEVKNNEMIRVDYVDGALRGQGLWEFESLEGKTKLSYRWQTSPSGLLRRILAPILPYKKSHSDVMKAGFNNLNRFLARKS